jgi:hypothetical protein
LHLIRHILRVEFDAGVEVTDPIDPVAQVLISIEI